MGPYLYLGTYLPMVYMQAEFGAWEMLETGWETETEAYNKFRAISWFWAGWLLT